MTFWKTIAEKITPYIVRIDTPDGHGTGFAFLISENRGFWGIATAWHVISQAGTWQQPIRIIQPELKNLVLLKEDERVIFSNVKRDSAVILVPTEKLNFPEPLVTLLPSGNRLDVGVDVGWLGFPGIMNYPLCFFSGSVSAWLEREHAYLVDGVAINGVSGGPVVCPDDRIGEVHLVGVITAYIPNRATGESLPGLSMIQDISHFHDTIAFLKSIDEARESKTTNGDPDATDSSIDDSAAPASTS